MTGWAGEACAAIVGHNANIFMSNFLLTADFFFFRAVGCDLDLSGCRSN